MLDINKWDTLDVEQLKAIVDEIVEKVPSSFIFQEIKNCVLADQTHNIAFFSYNKDVFAFIPGGEITLGYDRNNPFKPNKLQEADWKITEEEFGEILLEEFLDMKLTPLRTIMLKPFFIEVQPKKTDPSKFDSNEKMIEKVFEGGFRLPTSDEWEYACSAGSRTLFRWGNDCPADLTPYDNKIFDLHEKPNAFGLIYTGNPYNTELCKDGIYRNGDGGSAICGGLGNFASWISQASSYQEPEEEVAEWFVDEVYLRRVYDLK